MSSEEKLKEVFFLPQAERDIRKLPKGVRQDAGYNLYRVQRGDDPRNFSPLSHLGSGVMEIRVDEDTDTYRVIYVAKFEEAIYVLDAFQKKSPTGKKLPKNIENRIKDRYAYVKRNRPARAIEQG